MAFSGNGPVEEWIEVKREACKRRMETRMVMLKKEMTLNDTDREMVM